MKKSIKRLAAAFLALSVLAGCSATPGVVQKNSTAPSVTESAAKSAFTDAVTVDGVQIGDETVALGAEPALSAGLKTVASGVLTQKNSKAVIDYSNTKDGYVMVKYTASTSQKLKVQVTGPSKTTYTYNIKAGGDWTTFPLSDGNGSYKVTVYENISGNKYATVLSATFSVTLTDEFAPFLRSNQYVNFADAPKSVAKAAELTKGMTDPLKKVKAVYSFVVTGFTYDKQKASNLQSGYVSSLDSILGLKKGICLDYAAMMAGMLRSQGVPCKLVVGYAGTAYHAWINVYSKDKGWINAAIYFDGKNWKLMDPTFASTANQSSEIMKYIGDGSHYTAKYLY